MIYLITGGAGFIGSNFIHFLRKKEPDSFIINLDKLTYAGNLNNLTKFSNDDNYKFYHGDIADKNLVEKIFKEHKIDILINFAAETHVDRSIIEPDSFIKTDIYGTYVLLEAIRNYGVKKFIQISTDEVYGSTLSESFKENDELKPSNPYSASKAGADRMAYSYFKTYDLPIIITRASNNYGPYQYPEKLIPLFVTNALENKKLPVYGDGLNVRDWLYVEDHCSAIYFLLEKGKNGEVYNVGGGNERKNIEITKKIIELTGKSEDLIKYVKDRQGHDRRYSLNIEKIRKLGWMPKFSFEGAFAQTVEWYKNNKEWWETLKSGEYLEYYKRNYKNEV